MLFSTVYFAIAGTPYYKVITFIFFINCEPCVIWTIHLCYKNIKTEGRSLQMFLVYSVLSLKMFLTSSFFFQMVWIVIRGKFLIKALNWKQHYFLLILLEGHGWSRGLQYNLRTRRELTQPAHKVKRTLLQHRFSKSIQRRSDVVCSLARQWFVIVFTDEFRSNNNDPKINQNRENTYYNRLTGNKKIRVA